MSLTISDILHFPRIPDYSLKPLTHDILRVHRCFDRLSAWQVGAIQVDQRRIQYGIVGSGIGDVTLPGIDCARLQRTRTRPYRALVALIGIKRQACKIDAERHEAMGTERRVCRWGRVMVEERGEE
jgi:hypothetical protein